MLITDCSYKIHNILVGGAVGKQVHANKARAWCVSFDFLPHNCQQILRQHRCLRNGGDDIRHKRRALKQAQRRARDHGVTGQVAPYAAAATRPIARKILPRDLFRARANKKRRSPGEKSALSCVAGRGGFEPPVEFKARQSLSRRSRSATPAPPRVFNCRRGGFMAEGEGFEPTLAFTKPVFKTGALNHSAIPPFIPAGRSHFITTASRGQEGVAQFSFFAGA